MTEVIQITELKKIKNSSDVKQLTILQIKELQTALNNCGFDSGFFDGILGQKTKTAWELFKKSTFQRDFDLIGPGSIQVLEKKVKEYSLQQSKVMSISDNGIKTIANFEGKRNSMYLDAVGLPTIGIGHLIKQGESFPSQMTDKEVYDLFRKDVKRFENVVNKLVKVKINQNQFDALVSWSFNCGEFALEDSTLLRVLNEGNYNLAADNFLKWNMGGGQVIYGLTVRRQKERELFLKV